MVQKATKPAKDEIGRIKSMCPWCNYDNDDPDKGPVHKKVASTLVDAGIKLQCLTCGKMWDRADIKKPWSIEVERGAKWTREQESRRIR